MSIYLYIVHDSSFLCSPQFKPIKMGFGGQGRGGDGSSKIKRFSQRVAEGRERKGSKPGGDKSKDRGDEAKTDEKDDAVRKVKSKINEMKRDTKNKKGEPLDKEKRIEFHRRTGTLSQTPYPVTFDCLMSANMGIRLLFGSNGFLFGLLLTRLRSIVSDTARPELIPLDPLLTALVDVSALGMISSMHLASNNIMIYQGNMPNGVISDPCYSIMLRMMDTACMSNVGAAWCQFLGDAVMPDGKKLWRHGLLPVSPPDRIGDANMPVTAGTAAQKFDVTRGTDSRLLGYELPPAYCILALGLYGANAAWDDFTAVMNHIGTPAPRNYVTYDIFPGPELHLDTAKDKGCSVRL